MREITLEELLEAGCHFGHQVTRQNPKARDFVFEARDGIHIIDLEKTKQGLDEAAEHLKNLASKGGSLLVVGTKRQVKSIISEEIKRIREELSKNTKENTDGLFTITTRWIGGTFTNFAEVAKNYKKLKDLKENLQKEEFKEKYTKKEIGLFEKERQKLESFYGGVFEMKQLPDAVFVIDTHLESIVVEEARKAGITTVGIVDTNSDPNIIDYPIPSNDDAAGALKIIIGYLMDAWLEGKKNQISNIKNQKEEEKETEQKSLEEKTKADNKEKKEKTIKKKETVKKELKPKKKIKEKEESK